MRHFRSLSFSFSIALCLIAGLSRQAVAQISHGGTPYSFSNEVSFTMPRAETPVNSSQSATPDYCATIEG